MRHTVAAPATQILPSGRPPTRAASDTGHRLQHHARPAPSRSTRPTRPISPGPMRPCTSRQPAAADHLGRGQPRAHDHRRGPGRLALTGDIAAPAIPTYPTSGPSLSAAPSDLYIAFRGPD